MTKAQATTRVWGGLADSSAWQASLDAVSEHLGAEHLVVVTSGETPTANRCWSSGIPSEYLPLLARYSEQISAFSSAMPIGLAAYSDTFFPRRTLHRTELFQNAIRPMGGYQSMVARPFDKGFCAACRSERAKPFSDEALNRMKALLPAFSIALELKARLTRLEAHTATLEGALDVLDLGVIFIDGRGEIVYLNRSADAILSEGRVLDHCSRGFVGPCRSVTQNLRRMVKEVDGRPYFLSVPGRSDALVLRAFPAPSGPLGLRNGDGSDSTTMVLVIRDFHSGLKKSIESIGAVFGLTARESQIAELLVRGLNPAAIAAELKLSVGNVRIHLKRIFVKTDTHSQANLVRLFVCCKC